MIKMFDSRPNKCNVCGGSVTYGRMIDFGLRPYQSGYCYYCKNCGAYVGTHKKSNKEALGILSNGKTRKLRVICHNEFDKHWMSLSGKNKAYFRLSKEMEIKSEECHFGYMDEKQLKQALTIMKGWGDLCLR